MTTWPERVPEDENIAQRLIPGESITMAELRLSVRDTVARGISLVLDQDRLLRRLADVIADGTGYPGIAIYIRAIDSPNTLELGANTAAVDVTLPARLPIHTLGNLKPSTQAALSFGFFPSVEGIPTLSLALADQQGLVGVVLLLDAVPEAFTDEDVRAIAVVAEEIGPVVGVALRHHQIQRHSVIDVFTGAHTWEYLERRLGEELSRSHRSGHSTSLILMNMAGFEAFENDLGYEIADELLRVIAHGLGSLTRVSDVVARYRRTGFGILLPESDATGVDVTLARIRERTEEMIDSAASGNSPHRPLLAVGSSIFPEDGDDAASLIMTAEQRLLADEADLNFAI